MTIDGDTNQYGNQEASPAAGASGTNDKLVTHAKQVASHVSDKAKDLLGSEIEQTQKRSVGELGHVADVLRSAKQELGDSAASPIVEAAADQIERASKYLEKATLADVANELETLARREPLLFFGGAFALGVLGARFLKSSARHGQDRLESRSQGSAKSMEQTP